MDLRASSPSIGSIPLDPNVNVSFSSPGPPSAISFTFLPDGKSVAFAVQERGVDNIWVQPLNGDRIRQITRFKDELIYDFRWSRDGSHLAVNRGVDLGDIVLLQEKGTPRE